MKKMKREWFNAVLAGNDERVAELLAEQPDLIEAIDRETRNTALHYAAEAGDEKVVARLLAARPTSLPKNSHGLTALDMAACGGHDKVVAQLLATHVNVVISWSLFEAVRNNYDKVVDQLLTATHLTISGNYAAIALVVMVEAGYRKGFTQLLAICPSLIEGGYGASACFEAARCGHDDMLSQMLALHPQLIDEAGCVDGCNVLMGAAEGGRQDIVDTLLAMKPELIFSVSKKGNTVLHHAVKGCGGPEFVAKLWRMNPQALMHANDRLETPFCRAIEFKKADLIELFQWSLPFDDIVSAFADYSADFWQERYRPVMEQLCESLFVNLNQDVVGTVLEYVGIDVAKRANKRKKL